MSMCDDVGSWHIHADKEDVASWACHSCDLCMCCISHAHAFPMLDLTFNIFSEHVLTYTTSGALVDKRGMIDSDSDRSRKPFVHYLFKIVAKLHWASVCRS